MKHIQCIARAIVGGILIYAGLIKAVGPSAEFAAMIAAYKILPSSLVPILSVVLPYIEMWVGLFVLGGLYTRWASLAAIILLGTFFMALVSSLVRGIDLVSCGCFGADSLSPQHTMVLDSVLLVLSYYIFRQAKSPIPLPCSLDNSL